MLNLQRILGSQLARAAGGVGLLAALSAVTACGQRGPLYLPAEPAAANRATLPQVLIPALPRGEAAGRQEDAQPAAPPPTSDDNIVLPETRR